MTEGQILQEQKITKQVTISNGASGSISINIPSGRTAFLKGYGYSWYTSSLFTLTAGLFTFPQRSDAEGNISIPMQYSRPYPIKAGENIVLNIINNDSSSHTYTVVFYLMVDAVLNEISTGGDLVVQTGGSSGTGNNVAIFDSTFASAAPVDSILGLAVNDKSPTTLLAGSKATTGAGSIVLAASTACREVTIQADPTLNGSEIMYIGNSSAQNIILYAGQSIVIKTSNLANIFIKRGGSANVTANYIGG